MTSFLQQLTTFCHKANPIRQSAEASLRCLDLTIHDEQTLCNFDYKTTKLLSNAYWSYVRFFQPVQGLAGYSGSGVNPVVELENECYQLSSSEVERYGQLVWSRIAPLVSAVTTFKAWLAEFHHLSVDSIVDFPVVEEYRTSTISSNRILLRRFVEALTNLTNDLDALNQLCLTCFPSVRYLDSPPSQTSFLSTDINDVNTVELKQTLEECFEHTSKYKTIMELLVEKGSVQANTYIWLDTRAGYKTLIIMLIKYLQTQGFYKDNAMPSTEEIISIAKKTFGVDLSQDLVKKTKVPSGNTHNLSFILPASTYQ